MRVSIHLAMLALIGCGDQTGPSGKSSRPSTTPGSATVGDDAAATGGPELAETPRIDLLSNRFLWHVYRDGLVVPIASEGLRKYSQEYSQPWGDVVEVAGKRGRALTSRAATLRVPWKTAGKALLVLRLHGATGGQRITFRVNGKSAGNLSVGGDWQAISLPVELRAGENEIQLSLARRGSAGGTSAYALVHSLEILPGDAGQPHSWPPLSPFRQIDIAGDARPALTGFRSMELYVEIPPTAHLVIDTGVTGQAVRLSISAHTGNAEPISLLAVDQPPGEWARRRISLAPLAGKLVRLTLSGDPGTAWANGRIALEAATVRPRPEPVRHAILFVVDALRADRLEVYGETRVRTPRITRESRDRGVVFLHNQAASPSSPPSHGSIQTGMIPRVHGVSGDTARLSPGTPMISTQLEDAGVATGYYGNNAFGMGRLEKPGRWTEFHQPAREGLGIDCTALIPEMLGFANKVTARKSRFFISSLPYEPHTPYRYHPGITDRFHAGPWGPPVGKQVGGELLSAISAGRTKLTDAQWAQLRALYDGEVEYMDGCFSSLLDGLAELGVADSTAVIITADHGEGLFEHGRMGHAFGHYAELGNVPLIVLAPRLVDSGREIETVTSHLDIAPTVLDLMGVAPSERIQGISLLPLILRDGPWTPRVMPLEYGRSYALRARQWKYIVGYSGEESLYDVVTDPTEQTNLAGKDHFALRYMRDVAGFFLAHRVRWRMDTWGSLNNHDHRFIDAVTGKGS